MENSLIHNQLMDDMLKIVEKEVLINSDNAIKNQTDLQKVNGMIVSNTELFIPTTCAPCIGDVSETETENQFKCSNFPLIKPKVSMQIFTSENMSTFNDEATDFNKSGRNNLVQRGNHESEPNTDKTKNIKAEDSFPIHKTIDDSDSFKPDTTNENFTYPEKQIMDLNKGDSDVQTYLNKTLKLESNLLVSDKAVKKENKIKECFSLSSLERDFTLDYASSSDDSQFFLTKRPVIETSFQEDIERYSSEKTCDESQSSVKSDRKAPQSKKFKCRWLRSNRVSPDQLQPEVEGKSERKSKTKPKARRFATSFAKGIRNSFKNVKKAYRSKRQLHLFVFCPVPIFFRCL